ncbi:hypothetical protein GUJ93_ZPchr0007g5453 [Zizania palustris]|uniref:Uncharacterized protein n=1 Tax=Zizania palustris TaxID=103762 RepID=A0A8J5TGD9_ZIZPA|nr:hypothetical protein GUJ93_ZPchr0007g5453 [Zizania palustris]
MSAPARLPRGLPRARRALTPRATAARRASGGRRPEAASGRHRAPAARRASRVLGRLAPLQPRARRLAPLQPRARRAPRLPRARLGPPPRAAGAPPARSARAAASRRCSRAPRAARRASRAFGRLASLQALAGARARASVRRPRRTGWVE